MRGNRYIRQGRDEVIAIPTGLALRAIKAPMAGGWRMRWSEKRKSATRKPASAVGSRLVNSSSLDARELKD
jgi:hypothetical protein